jgi:hypothetical protein
MKRETLARHEKVEVETTVAARNQVGLHQTSYMQAAIGIGSRYARHSGMPAPFLYEVSKILPHQP